MRAYVVTAPHEGGVARPAALRRPGRARSSSTSTGSASAAPTSSSSPARWPTCTRATRRTRCDWATSGAASSPPSVRGVDERWLGRRVTGDTMIGCGRCRALPVRAAQRLRGPVRDRHPRRVPRRARRAAGRAGDSAPRPAGRRRRHAGSDGRAGRQRAAGRPRSRRRWRGRRPAPLVLGHRDDRPARRRARPRQGAEVHLVGEDPTGPSRFARTAGLRRCLATRRPAGAGVGRRHRRLERGLAPGHWPLDLVEPGRAPRLHRAGRYAEPGSTPATLALKDVTAVGILAGSQGLAGAIERYAAGAVDPRPLVAATVGLDQVGDVLAGWRPADAGPGPKIHVDPRDADLERRGLPGMGDFDGPGRGRHRRRQWDRGRHRRAAAGPRRDGRRPGPRRTPRSSGATSLEVAVRRHRPGLDRGAIATVVDALGGIDVLVNNAGIGAVGDVAANDDDEWHRVLDVNVVGIARVTRAALPWLRRSAARQRGQHLLGRRAGRRTAARAVRRQQGRGRRAHPGDGGRPRARRDPGQRGHPRYGRHALGRRGCWTRPRRRGRGRGAAQPAADGPAGQRRRRSRKRSRTWPARCPRRPPGRCWRSTAGWPASASPDADLGCAP